MAAPWWDPVARERWTQAPLAGADPGFELCDTCAGGKGCGLDPHPYCSGWCHTCGGAGQWPLDPETPWFAPSPPLIDVDAQARARNPPPEAPRSALARWLDRLRRR
ncbi:MAG: hypothetical protein ABMA64_08100 [Myxococcota bacterium]